MDIAKQLPKLKLGDEIRVVAPSRSLKLLTEEHVTLSTQKLEEIGLTVSFGKNVYECDDFMSSSIASRVQDLHDAFSDKNVKMILPVIGGYNSNQLLPYLDLDLIAKNPKYFGGYSDTTALQNAINSKTELTTFQSPAFSMFGKTRNNEYAINYFKKCFLENGEYEISPSEKWDDDTWYLDQESYELFDNEGFWYIQYGSDTEIQGKIIGGNLCTLNLLQGTEFMPKFTEDTILFLEDDYESKIGNFDRDLTSLIQQENFQKYVKAILIGRFQRKSEISKEILSKMISNKLELENILVISNLDFGHTYPAFTFPIGGVCRIENNRIFVQYS